MVFKIGGGNYNDYQNLLTYAKGQQPPRSIWYGCTELLNPEAFLHPSEHKPLVGMTTG
ncbi:hypothetical protein PF005_g12331 [Phytophthora fragariae]|nr:hypothetical protein PF005_g12331 [Phytophthora fragariae]KAE9284549.1 hypothetical protein PF008_g27131 [Phytophthora fragariae]